MLRSIAFGLFAFSILTPSCPADGFRLKPKEDLPRPKMPRALPGLEMVRDLAYVPSVGDRSVLVGTAASTASAFLTPNQSEFATLRKFTRARDIVGYEKMIDEGRAGLTPNGTRVIVVEVYASRAAADIPAACEVRLIDGPYADQLAWCEAADVARFDERDTAAEARATALAEAEREQERLERYHAAIATRDAIDQAARDAMAKKAHASEAFKLMGEARSLVAKKRAGAAKDVYRRLAEGYPDTPEGKEAARKVKAFDPPKK